jgi:type II secretory pathway pseudopilin PulG
LIELLVVMLVIVILAGIVFKAGRALLERGKIQQAKADIARLSMALERYYTDHGHYPPGGTGQGNVGLNTRDFVVGPGWTEVAKGHGAPNLWAYLDEDCDYRRDRRAYVSGWPKDRLGSIPMVGNVLRYYKDPWGNPYRYYTVVGNLEDRGAYMLASAGPDGASPGDNPGPDDIWAGTGTSGEQMGR